MEAAAARRMDEGAGADAGDVGARAGQPAAPLPPARGRGRRGSRAGGADLARAAGAARPGGRLGGGVLCSVVASTVHTRSRTVSRKSLLSLAVLLATVLLAFLSHASAEEGKSIDLFNGKDFTGWNFFLDPRSKVKPEA